MWKIENNGKFKAADINKKALEMVIKELKGLGQFIKEVKKKFPSLVHWRVPGCNSAAPLQKDFGIIVKTLLGTAKNTPVIINAQVGLSKATTGCVAAWLFKNGQISVSFEGLVETVPRINAAILKTDNCQKVVSPDMGKTIVKCCKNCLSVFKKSVNYPGRHADNFLQTAPMMIANYVPPGQEGQPSHVSQVNGEYDFHAKK